MIHELLSILQLTSNNFLKEELKVDEELILVSPLQNLDGTSVNQGSNKIIITLVDIHDVSALMRNQDIIGHREKYKAKRFFEYSILVSAASDANNYLQTLEILSLLIDYYESNPIFSNTLIPDANEESYSFRLVPKNLSQEQTDSLWLRLGLSYLPSMLYKLQLLQEN